MSAAPGAKQKDGVGDDWGTPPDLWEEIRYRFFAGRGDILDPCPGRRLLAHTVTMKNQPARPDAGAWRSASDAVYINPPFSEVGPWVEAAFEFGTVRRGSAVLLLPVRPDRPWWMLANRGTMVTICDRVAYIDPTTGAAGKASNFPSCLILFTGAQRLPMTWWPKCHITRALSSRQPSEWRTIARHVRHEVFLSASAKSGPLLQFNPISTLKEANECAT